MITPLRFGLRFIVTFAVLMGAFEASRGTAFERFVVVDLILVPTAGVINAATPTEHVELAGRSMVSPGAHLNVTRGCEGVEMFLLLVAGILAFPATLKQRVQGLLVGSLLAYLLSVARLIALYYVLKHSPNLWEALHGLVLPLGPVALIGLYFLRWTARSSVARPPESDPHVA